MGARLVRAAVKVGDLRPRAHIVLITMAVLTLDSDRGNKSAGTYYGGRIRLLAEMNVYPTDQTLHELKRDIRDLVQHGYIKRVAPPAPGQAAVYALCIGDG